MDSVVQFSAAASCACCAHARLESSQPTIKGWRTAVDQLINGLGTTL
jgi:hypothetical protein